MQDVLSQTVSRPWPPRPLLLPGSLPLSGFSALGLRRRSGPGLLASVPVSVKQGRYLCFDHTGLRLGMTAEAAAREADFAEGPTPAGPARPGRRLLRFHWVGLQGDGSDRWCCNWGDLGIFPGAAARDSRCKSASRCHQHGRRSAACRGTRLSQPRCLDVRSLSHPEIPHLGRCLRGAFVPGVPPTDRVCSEAFRWRLEGFQLQSLPATNIGCESQVRWGAQLPRPSSPPCPSLRPSQSLQRPLLLPFPPSPLSCLFREAPTSACPPVSPAGSASPTQRRAQWGVGCWRGCATAPERTGPGGSWRHGPGTRALSPSIRAEPRAHLP